MVRFHEGIVGQVLAEALVTTLMGILDSPFWRDHIPEERWDIIRLISVLGGNLPRLRTHDHNSYVFTQWVAVMGMKYLDLPEAKA